MYQCLQPFVKSTIASLLFLIVMINIFVDGIPYSKTASPLSARRPKGVPEGYMEKAMMKRSGEQPNEEWFSVETEELEMTFPYDDRPLVFLHPKDLTTGQTRFDYWVSVRLTQMYEEGPCFCCSNEFAFFTYGQLMNCSTGNTSSVTIIEAEDSLVWERSFTEGSNNLSVAYSTKLFGESSDSILVIEFFLTGSKNLTKEFSNGNITKVLVSAPESMKFSVYWNDYERQTPLAEDNGLDPNKWKYHKMKFDAEVETSHPLVLGDYPNQNGYFDPFFMDFSIDLVNFDIFAFSFYTVEDLYNISFIFPTFALVEPASISTEVGKPGESGFEVTAAWALGNIENEQEEVFGSYLLIQVPAGEQMIYDPDISIFVSGGSSSSSSSDSDNILLIALTSTLIPLAIIGTIVIAGAGAVTFFVLKKRRINAATKFMQRKSRLEDIVT